MNRQPYPTDLSDAEWHRLAPLVPRPKAGGRPPKYPRREIVNAILYVVRSGGAWRLLPHDFPSWRIVYHYFRLWKLQGLWKRIHDRLRKLLRQAEGRARQPSAAILDSQSVKTTERGGKRGYDAGKHVNGRKRHILVDTLGLLLIVVVTAASTQDRDGAHLLLEALSPPLDTVALDLGRWLLVWGVDRVGVAVASAAAHQAGDCPAQGCGSRIRGLAEAVDCRAHVWVAQPMSALEQGLRVLDRDE